MAARRHWAGAVLWRLAPRGNPRLTSRLDARPPAAPAIDRWLRRLPRLPPTWRRASLSPPRGRPPGRSPSRTSGLPTAACGRRSRDRPRPRSARAECRATPRGDPTFFASSTRAPARAAEGSPPPSSNASTSIAFGMARSSCRRAARERPDWAARARYGPSARGLARGFIAYDRLDGAPMRARNLTDELLVRTARSCAARASDIPVPPPRTGALEEMVRHNGAEELARRSISSSIRSGRPSSTAG